MNRLPLPENLQHITLAIMRHGKNQLLLTPPFEGQNMKLEFLLFNETDKNRPYRDLHLWIDVNATEATEGLEVPEVEEDNCKKARNLKFSG